MSRRVRLLPKAERDLIRLIAFLVDDSPRSARRAGTVIREALKSLNRLPDRGRLGPEDGLRELVAPFGRAAYIIQYRVGPSEVLVARIFHSREDRR